MSGRHPCFPDECEQRASAPMAASTISLQGIVALREPEMRYAAKLSVSANKLDLRNAGCFALMRPAKSRPPPVPTATARQTSLPAPHRRLPSKVTPLNRQAHKRQQMLAQRWLQNQVKFNMNFQRS